MTVRIAYFDCFSGASGDMLLGSLIDAGLREGAGDLRVEIGGDAYEIILREDNLLALPDGLYRAHFNTLRLLGESEALRAETRIDAYLAVLLGDAVVGAHIQTRPALDTSVLIYLPRHGDFR